MIYTVTLNPSVDYVVQVDDFQLGTLNRTRRNEVYPGGKGINVSRVLNRLSIPSTALGFIGGFTGQYIETILQKEGVRTDFVTTDGLTRINIKLKSEKETEINGEGMEIPSEKVDAFFQKIDKLQRDDLLVIAGSAPRSLPKDLYEKVAELARKKGVKLVVDVSGSPLSQLVTYSPFFMKPNHHELGELFQREITNVAEAVHCGQQLIEQGVEHLVISMAEQGALYLNREGVWKATVPKGTVKNSVGAGDSLVAGFIGTLAKTNDVMAAFRFGVASGSATAFSEDLCKREDVEALLPEVQIAKL
ncbi:1-phosphofructokinase [Fervidibacillus albus]|uniref:Tagatose-6-phosphate kinase n=1 Tax=Fervidibacillus albus TaxID=2980026 RepID=A0A9E8LUH3_9BACI|nr:1-phosphofructokinase [Fervidibacillus albus]WAA09878.1 1-phosphofructokinase [Fervidibacillus albus]